MICQTLTRQEANEIYLGVLEDCDFESINSLCKSDLFFLLTVACNRSDINQDWLYDRCREVEAEPDGMLDLWAREHYKSTLITYGLTIKDILNDPEETFGIFSHTRPIAKSFLEQIKRELESNEFLKTYFPDVLYQDPQKESPRWSLDGGIIVKRKSNPKEATVEAWGLVDGQPTSKHYGTQVFDDVVTRESVTTPEMIHKVTDAWALSLNLGADREMADGKKRACRRRYTGTRYHTNDTYSVIIERGAAKVRLHYPTDLGKDDLEVLGRPYLKTKEDLVKKRQDMGKYIYGCQMLMDPTADKSMGFSLDWINHYNQLRNNERWNYYLLCDPAGEKKKENDYTVMAVVGLAPDDNYYLVDGIRDRLNLTQRAEALIKLHRKWKPRAVGYEKYGKDSDIEHIEYAQEVEGYRFVIIPLGGSMAKNDRIRRLVPIFEKNRFWMPHRLIYTTAEGKAADFIQQLIDDEYCDFPVSKHDDMMDCLSRIVDVDLGARFPKIETDRPMFIQPVRQYDPLVGNTHEVLV